MKGMLQTCEKFRYFSLKNVGYFMTLVHNGFNYMSVEDYFGRLFSQEQVSTLILKEDNYRTRRRDWRDYIHT